MPNQKIVTVKQVKTINAHRKNFIYAKCRYIKCERDYNNNNKKKKNKVS